MANLKEIRNRIGSVSSTMQITSAMKMVSAAKLKKAQDAITAMRPYSNKLTQMLVNLSSSIEILMMIYFICSITAGIAGEFIAIAVVQTSYRFLHLQNQCECVTTAMKNLWRIHDG